MRPSRSRFYLVYDCPPNDYSHAAVFRAEMLREIYQSRRRSPHHRTLCPQWQTWDMDVFQRVAERTCVPGRGWWIARQRLSRNPRPCAEIMLEDLAGLIGMLEYARELRLCSTPHNSGSGRPRDISIRRDSDTYGCLREPGRAIPTLAITNNPRSDGDGGKRTHRFW